MYPTTDHPQDLPKDIHAVIQRALAEDIGPGDATTNSIVPSGATMRGQIIAKQDGIIAGLDVARLVFLTLDDQIQFEIEVQEGVKVSNRQRLASLAGPARAVLTGERTALNFLGRMSGIATQTRAYVDAVAGTHAGILDTRKTAPDRKSVV